MKKYKNYWLPKPSSRRQNVALWATMSFFVALAATLGYLLATDHPILRYLNEI